MRRRDVLAGMAAVGVALSAGLYRFTNLFVKHYPATPYDDLLEKLTDREQAAKFGAKVSETIDAPGQAVRLRAALKGRSLADTANADLAAGRVVEVDGWVLPQTVAWLSALAAKA